MSDDVLQLEGADELNSVLNQLLTADVRIGNKVTRSALQAGSTETARRQRRKAPSGTIRKAIGSRVRKKRGANEWTAKAGGNVGKKKRIAPHFHFHTLGTELRRTKTGANRGRMKANSFVADAMRNTRPVIEKMRKKTAERTEIEVARAAKT